MMEAMAAEHPAPVHLIVGPEEYLAERHRMDIVAATRAAEGDTTIPLEQYKANELEPGELIELLSPSLFAEARIILIHSVEEVGKEVIDMISNAIANPVAGMVLIIVHKGKGRNKRMAAQWRKKHVAVHEAPQLNARERQGFVDKEFRRHNTRVSPDVVQYLIEAVGSDLRELATAISQLVADTQGKVDVAAVKRYYGGKAEVSGFEVADFAVQGNVAAAMALTRRSIQLGESLVMISSALSRAVSGIAKVAGRGRINAAKEARNFGMAPWQLEKTVRFARNWTPTMVARGVQITAELDLGVKGQRGDQEFVLEWAVYSIAKMVETRGQVLPEVQC